MEGVHVRLVTLLSFIPTNSYVQNNFRAKIIGIRIFQAILLNNNTLIIINNTTEKNCCYFPIEYRSGNIIYCNKTLKIVVCDVTFCFFDNFDVTALKPSRKPRVAGCARMRENLVQFYSKQENQARIIIFVNKQCQNYQVSLNIFFVILFSKHNKLHQQTIPFIDCIMSTQLYKRCKVIDSVSDETKAF